MAGALGMLLGAGLGAAKGYAGEKLQKEHQSEAAWHDFMSNAINTQPEIAGTAEGQKEIKRMYGEHADAVTMALHMKSQAMQKSQSEMATAFGQGGGAAPTAGATTPATGAPAMPNDLATLRDHISKGEAFLGSPDAQYLQPYQVKAATQHLEDMRKRADTLDTQNRMDERRAKYDSPEAKGAIKNAQIAAETSPANVAAEARRAGAITGAQVAQRLKGVKPEEHFATAQAQLQSLSPLERTKAVNALYQQNYGKTDNKPKLVPDPANPGKFKLSTTGDSKPSLEEFARAYGVDMRTGEMVSDAAPVAPNGGSTASAPAAAPPSGRAAPEINIPGRGKGTLSGTTTDGRPIYAFPDGSKLAVKAASMRKAGLSGGSTGASVSGR